MTTMNTVKVKVLREYPVGHRTYRKGEVIEVSEDLAKRMEQTRPPYAERVKEPKADPTPAKDAKSK